VGSWIAILTDDPLVKRVCAKFVPRLLTDDQREQRQTIDRELFVRSCKDVQPKRKQQTSQWKGPNSPRPRKGRQVQSKTKVMLLTFFDSEGILHHEYAPEGQTIIKEYYVEISRRLRESVRRKRPEKWRDGDWILNHDNAPAHTSHLVQRFVAKHGTAQ